MFNVEQYLKDKFYEQSLVEKIQTLSLGDKEAVNKLLEELQPNANIFRQIFCLLEEISAAQAKPISEIINSIKLKEGNRKEKQIQLRGMLEQTRYPMRFKIQKKLEDCVEQISNEFGVNLILPEELEGETIELKFKVRGVKDLEKKSEKIQALIQSKICEKIFDILEGKEL